MLCETCNTTMKERKRKGVALFVCPECSSEHAATIGEVFAFVATGEGQPEHILTLTTQQGIFPMIATTPDDAEVFRPYVDQFLRDSQKTVRLVRFSAREIVQVLTRNGGTDLQ